MFENTIEFIQEIYKSKEFIPLHEPRFSGNEKNILTNALIQLLFHRLVSM